MGDNDYFRRRAVEELAAAEWATCPEAKRVHRDLAKRYMTLIKEGRGLGTSASSGSPSLGLTGRPQVGERK